MRQWDSKCSLWKISYTVYNVHTLKWFEIFFGLRVCIRRREREWLLSYKRGNNYLTSERNPLKRFCIDFVVSDKGNTRKDICIVGRLNQIQKHFVECMTAEICFVDILFFPFMLS